MARKGRSHELIIRRDAKIVARFVYWTEDQLLRTDVAIKHMSMNEFFVSEKVLYSVIAKAARTNGDKRSKIFPNPKLPNFTKEEKELFRGEKHG